MSSTTSSSPESISRQKRRRAPPGEQIEPNALENTGDEDDEPSLKLARHLAATAVDLDDEMEVDDNDIDDEQLIIPLAPGIREYMEPGGTVRYRPRPEWLIMTDDDGSAPSDSQHDLPLDCRRRQLPALQEAEQHPSSNNNNEASAFAVQQRGRRYVDDEHHTADNNTPGDNLARLDSLQSLFVRGGDHQPSIHNNNNRQVLLFGRDLDPALNLTIRENATEAALALIESGASVEAGNAKGVTPLILAAQKGNIAVTRALLRHGANPAKPSMNGSTAALQASHFGQVELLELLLDLGGPHLIEIANSNLTTPLMRAAQEGHDEVVELLLQRGGGTTGAGAGAQAAVNRFNRVQMTALMLASQRGHASICQRLLDAGADVDAKTNQDSTSLLLACKRGNVDVVRVLVTAGCELWIKDARGRTARDVARRRGIKELTDLIDSSVQVDLMQRKARRERSFEMIRLWHLLQQDRAVCVPFDDSEATTVRIHEIDSLPDVTHLLTSRKSTQTLLKTMTLPAPLVESISQFLPVPHLWRQRMSMLTKRAVVDPNAAVTSALDLVDEILEESGFLEACDKANITPPPTGFSLWREWKGYVRRTGRVKPEQSHGILRRRLDVTTAVVPDPADPDQPTLIELRRQMGYLQILALHNRSTTTLPRILSFPPYNMPSQLLQQLIRTSDLASLTRRMGTYGIRFEASVAMDLITLINDLVSWYWCEREGGD